MSGENQPYHANRPVSLAISQPRVETPRALGADPAELDQPLSGKGFPLSSSVEGLPFQPEPLLSSGLAPGSTMESPEPQLAANHGHFRFCPDNFTARIWGQVCSYGRPEPHPNANTGWLHLYHTCINVSQTGPTSSYPGGNTEPSSYNSLVLLAKH